MTGPTVVPIAAADNIIGKYLPRSRRGTKSQQTTSRSTYAPPMPKPWMVRPLMSMAGFLAPAAIPLPKVNSMMARSMGFRRPKILEIWAKSGCGTVEAMTKELAIHTYCSCPPISRVIVGRAVTTMVASSPEMNETRQRARNTHQKRHECDVDSDGVSIVSFGEDSSPIFGSHGDNK